MEEIRRTNVSFRAKRTRYRCSLQFQSTLSDTHRSGHRFANLSLFLRIVIDQEDGGKFYPSKVIDTISRFEREKKSSIFVQNFVKKKKKSAARVKQCSYEIRIRIRSSPVPENLFHSMEPSYNGAPFIPRSFIKTKFYHRVERALDRYYYSNEK